MTSPRASPLLSSMLVSRRATVSALAATPAMPAVSPLPVVFSCPASSLTASVSKSSSRRKLGTLYSLLPAPMPEAIIRYSSGSLPDVRIAAATAAPVGVTSSPSMWLIFSLRLCCRAILVTAGTGTAIMPCWQRMVPQPSVRLPTTTPSSRKSSRQTAMTTISTMESTAPTS